MEWRMTGASAKWGLVTMKQNEDNARGGTVGVTILVLVGLLALVAVIGLSIAGSNVSTAGDADFQIAEDAPDIETTHIWSVELGAAVEGETHLTVITLDYPDADVQLTEITESDVSVEVDGESVATGDVVADGPLWIGVDDEVTVSEGDSVSVTVENVPNPAETGDYVAAIELGGPEQTIQQFEEPYSISEPDEDVDLSIDHEQSTLDVVEGEEVEVTVGIESLGLTGLLDVELYTDDEFRTAESVELDLFDLTSVTLTFEAEAADDGATVLVDADGDIVEETLSVATEPLFDVAFEDLDDQIGADEELVVDYSVTNLGDLTGVQDIEFLVDGTVVDTADDVELAGEDTTEGTFTYEPTADAGERLDVGVRTLDTTVNSTVDLLDPALFEVDIDEEASTLDVVEGEEAEVVATVSNVGEIVDTTEILLAGDKTVYDSESHEILPGEAETISLSFEPTAEDDGLTVAVETLDDVATATLTVDVPGLFEIDIDEGASTLDVVAGEEAEIVAEVTNVGDVLGTQELSVTVDEEERTSQLVELPGGTSETITLDVETLEGDDGSVLAVETLDDIAAVELSVDLPALFDVQLAELDGEVVAGEDIDITFDVVNVGGVADTQSVGVVAGETEVGTLENVSLGVGETLTETVTYSTSEDDVPGVTISVSTLDEAVTATVDVLSPTALELTIDTGQSSLDVTAGEQAEVVVQLSNTGSEPVVDELAVAVDGDERAIQAVEVPAGATVVRTLSFAAEAEDDGGTVAAETTDDRDSATLTVEPEDELSASVDIAAPVVADDEEIAVDLSFDRIPPEGATLVVTNEDTGDTVTGMHSTATTVEVPAADLGGLDSGAVISAAVYETPEQQVSLDADAVEVQPVPTPSLSVPESVSVGTVDVGESETVSIDVANTGTAPLTVETAHIESPNFSVESVPSVVGAGETEPLLVSFAPTTTGGETAGLTIVSDDPDGIQTVDLTGTGAEEPDPAGELQVSPDAVSAGPIAVGDRVTTEVTVQNVGDGVLETVAVSISGPDDAAFAVETDPFEAVDGPASLAPGETATVVVAYEPAAAGTASETLSVDSGTDSTTVDLAGETADPSVSADPSTVEFGAVGVGESTTATVELAVGGAPVAFDSLAVAGDEHDAFDITAAPGTVGPGETGSVEVAFLPTTASDHAATVEAPDLEGQDGPLISLAGTALSGPPELAVSPESVRFDDVAVGETATATVDLENVGGEALTLSRVAVGDDDQFSLLEGAVETAGGEVTLGAGESRSVTVEFAPGSTGTDTTYLYVESDAATGAKEVVPVTSGPVESTVTVDQEDRQRLQTVVENASAGERVDLAFPDPLDDEQYETASVSVTPAVSGDLEIDVTSSGQTLETTPETRAGFADNTTRLGNVSATTNLANADIESVAFEAVVERGQLAAWDTDAGNVSFYRFDEDAGVWEEHETTVVEEREDEVLLRVEADGFSEWTAAAARPAFTITETDIDVTSTTTDDEVTIQVFVTNTGGTDGTYVVDLLLDDSVVDSDSALIAPDGQVLFQFERTLDEPGTYEVRVNDEFVAEVEVSESTAEVRQIDEIIDGDDTQRDLDDDGLVFGLPAVAALFAATVVLGLFGYRRLQRDRR